MCLTGFSTPVEEMQLEVVAAEPRWDTPGSLRPSYTRRDLIHLIADLYGIYVRVYIQVKVAARSRIIISVWTRPVNEKAWVVELKHEKSESKRKKKESSNPKATSTRELSRLQSACVSCT